MKKTYFIVTLLIVFFGLLTLRKAHPISLYYLFEIDGGINFFNQNKDTIINKYNLDDLRDTVAPVLNVRTGVVLDDHWIVLLGYGYIRRETYDYRLNYFTLNQKAYEERYIHNVHATAGYFLFPYQSFLNASFKLDVGYALYRSDFNTIDNYSAASSTGLRQRNQQILLNSHNFYISPSIKLYKNLRSGFGLGGDIYIGVQYPMLFPSKINFPTIVLGFDASIDFSYGTEETKRKTFASTNAIESATRTVTNVLITNK